MDKNYVNLPSCAIIERTRNDDMRDVWRFD